MRFLTKNKSCQFTRLTSLTKSQINMVSGGTLGGKTKDPRGEEASASATANRSLLVENK